jgi:phophatidylinositol-4-phosphate 5-kinase
MLGKDTYLNTKNGLIEYQDGRKIEFIHKNAIMNGPAIEYLANGDKEDFFYGNNEKKNGASIYYFANGEREEVAYKDGVLEGPAIYIFNDGVAEHYEYKNGKRVEE